MQLFGALQHDAIGIQVLPQSLVPLGQLHDPPNPEQIFPLVQSFGLLQQVLFGIQVLPQSLVPLGHEHVLFVQTCPLVHPGLQQVPAITHTPLHNS